MDDVDKIDETWRGQQVYHKPDANGTKRKVIKQACDYCAGEHFVRITEIKRDKGKYCSLRCAGKGNNRDVGGEKNPNYKDGRKSYVEKVKKDASCSKCGEDRAPCLVFHHEEPSKKIESISRMAVHRQYSIEDVKKEIEKCEIICMNCHALEHSDG